MFHIHFDPDTANCAKGGLKTPTTVSLIKDRYMFKDDTDYSIQDLNGAAYFSSRLKSIVVGS